jgi:hypothetical protein
MVGQSYRANHTHARIHTPFTIPFPSLGLYSFEMRDDHLIYAISFEELLLLILLFLSPSLPSPSLKGAK